MTRIGTCWSLLNWSYEDNLPSARPEGEQYWTIGATRVTTFIDELAVVAMMYGEVAEMDEYQGRSDSEVIHSALGTTESFDHLSILDREDLAKAVGILKRYGATGVYLFGSMAIGTGTEYSDWDLAVEGLPSSAFLPALAELSSTLHRPVDVVELDDGSRFASYLRTWERLLHVA